MPVQASKPSPVPAPADSASEPRQRDLAFPKKLRSACNSCNEVKLRCTGTQPCSRCKSRNLECVYSYAARTGKPKGSKNKKTLERLRLRELELEKQAEEGRLPETDGRLTEGSGHRQSETDQNIFSDSEDENENAVFVASPVMVPCVQPPQPSSTCVPEELHSAIIVENSWNSGHLPTPSNEVLDLGMSAERVSGPRSRSISHAPIKNPTVTLPEKARKFPDKHLDDSMGIDPMEFTHSTHNDPTIPVASDVGVQEYDAFAETFNFDETMYESLFTPSLVSGSVPTSTTAPSRSQASASGIEDAMPHASLEDYQGTEIDSYEALLLADVPWREQHTSKRSVSSSDGAREYYKNPKKPRCSDRGTAEPYCLRQQAEALDRLKQAEKRHGEPHPEAVLTLTTQVLDSSTALLGCRRCAVDYDFLYLSSRTLRVAAQWLRAFLSKPISGGSGGGGGGSGTAGLTLSLGVHRLSNEESVLVRNLLIARAVEKGVTLVRVLRERCDALAAQQDDAFLRPWDLAYMRLTLERLECDLRSVLKESTKME